MQHSLGLNSSFDYQNIRSFGNLFYNIEPTNVSGSVYDAQGTFASEIRKPFSLCIEAFIPILAA